MKLYSRKVLVRSMLAIMVICTILQAVGISMFNIPSITVLDSVFKVIDGNITMTNILFALMLTFNLVMKARICNNTENLRWEIVTVAFMFSFAIQDSNNMALVLMFELFLVITYYHGSSRDKIIQYLNLTIITFIYQALSSWYKFGVLDLSREFATGEMLLYSIDNMVLLIAIYIDKKGAERREKETTWTYLFYPFVRPEKVIRRECTEGEKSPDEDYQLTTGDQVLRAVVAILQLGLVATAVTINSRFIVFLIVYLIGFLPQKVTMRFDYHAENIIGCTVQSLITFYVACAIVPQVGISVLLPVVSGTVIVTAVLFLKKMGVLKNG